MKSKEGPPQAEPLTGRSDPLQSPLALAIRIPESKLEGSNSYRAIVTRVTVSLFPYHCLHCLFHAEQAYLSISIIIIMNLGSLQVTRQHLLVSLVIDCISIHICVPLDWTWDTSGHCAVNLRPPITSMNRNRDPVPSMTTPMILGAFTEKYFDCIYLRRPVGPI
jgi:hypothetical protein